MGRTIERGTTYSLQNPDTVGVAPDARVYLGEHPSQNRRLYKHLAEATCFGDALISRIRRYPDGVGVLYDVVTRD